MYSAQFDLQFCIALHRLPRISWIFVPCASFVAGSMSGRGQFRVPALKRGYLCIKAPQKARHVNGMFLASLCPFPGRLLVFLLLTRKQTSTNPKRVHPGGQLNKVVELSSAAHRARHVRRHQQAQ